MSIIYIRLGFGILCLRTASPLYQLDLEIAKKKSNFFKLAQNEALQVLVTKMLF